MNIICYDVMKALKKLGALGQRELAEAVGYSVGAVNNAVKELYREGYTDEKNTLTAKAYRLFEERAPKNAVILAAGFGTRMAPINDIIPKALLEVHGESLIERQIKLLRKAGIKKIYVVAGYMKEKLEYLIDSYGVELIVNNEYISKNNLHSLLLAQKHISNTYIVPCDIWCAAQPFDRDELYSWYAVSDTADISSEVRINRRSELVLTDRKAPGNAMIGIAYITGEDPVKLKEKMSQLAASPEGDKLFWEAALYSGNRSYVYARRLCSADYTEINTYEQLRDLDSGSGDLHSQEIKWISEVMNVSEDKITDIEVLKKGMTNRSFIFSCKGERYIMRVPGEGTDRLIDRKNEARVYEILSGRGICEDIVDINAENGYKLARYIDEVRTCDPHDENDVKRCMRKLREFHQMELKSEHRFDLFGQIEFYQRLWGNVKSVYRDHAQTTANVFSLKEYIDGNAVGEALTHIDAVPDNFLFSPDGEGGERLRLTDWEYSGMQDPYVDIAMFGIYSFYDRGQMDRLIDIYFDGKCSSETRILIYCYVSVCGLLWSNWCEYKRIMGVEFGEYSIRQYRYAKEYYRIVKELTGNV